MCNVSYFFDLPRKPKSWSGNYFKAKRKPLSFLFDLEERDRREDGCLKSSFFQQDLFFLYCEL
jgi:hypothetical protein